jgi:hypothetical protein
VTVMAIALMAAGIFLVRREVRRRRPASNAALAGDALMTAGTAWGAAAMTSGPLWPLACIPAAASLAIAAGTAVIVRNRRKAGR